MVQLPLTDARTLTPRAITTQQSLNSIIWSACDIMRRSNCAVPPHLGVKGAV